MARTGATPEGWLRAHHASSAGSRFEVRSDVSRFKAIVRAFRDTAAQGDMAALAELGGHVPPGLNPFVPLRKAYRAAARAGHLHIMSGIVVHVKAAPAKKMSVLRDGAKKVAFEHNEAQLDVRLLAMEHYLLHLSGGSCKHKLTKHLRARMLSCSHQQFVATCGIVQQLCATHAMDEHVLPPVAVATVEACVRWYNPTHRREVVRAFCPMGANSNAEELARSLMDVIHKYESKREFK